MSAPVSGFSKLSINPMQSSRTHAKGKGTVIEPEEDDDSSSSEEQSEEDLEEEPELAEEEVDGAATKSVYTHRIFAVDHCRHTGTYYAFQMACAQVERYSIRISTEALAEPTCSCAEPGTSCRHIMWLLQQLDQLSDNNTHSPLTPYEQISTRGLDIVCEEMQWEHREWADSDTEETRWQLKKENPLGTVRRQARGKARQRMQAVRDIMATMSPVVADDYRADIFDVSDKITDTDVFTKGDLEATVSKILILDDRIFDKFQDLVSRDIRASDYFNKMALKAKEACDRLDDFCEVGPSAGPYDLIWCAQTLLDIVSAISHNVAERQPLSSSSRESAAKALVFILGMVVRDRNHDVYQNPNLPRRRPHGEPQRDRNLYLRLIGDSRSSAAGGYFVIKALQDLPEALRFVDDLEDILRRLDSVGWAAPQNYRDKLGALILQLKSGSANPSPPGTSSGKRPAGSLDRKGNKRMK